MSIKRLKKNKIENKKQSFFFIKYFSLLFTSIIATLFFSLIIIKNFHFQHEQFQIEEIKRHNEKIKNLEVIKSIIENYMAKEKEIRNIKFNKIVFNEYNDKYFFYYEKKDILKREDFKKKFKIEKFNIENNFQKILNHATDKISYELKQLKKMLFSEKNEIDKEILDSNKKKINVIAIEIKKIKKCIKKINDNNSKVIILPKKFLFFRF